MLINPTRNAHLSILFESSPAQLCLVWPRECARAPVFPAMRQLRDLKRDEASAHQDSSQVHRTRQHATKQQRSLLCT